MDRPAQAINSLEHSRIAKDLLRLFIADRMPYSPTMQRPNDPHLKIAIERIVQAMAPEAIYLFGSRARGNFAPRSDYDLLVVVSDSAPEWAYSPAAAARIPREPGVALDVVPCRRSAFERRKNQIGTISRRVATEGRLVYGR